MTAHLSVPISSPRSDAACGVLRLRTCGIRAWSAVLAAGAEDQVLVEALVGRLEALATNDRALSDRVARWAAAAGSEGQGLELDQAVLGLAEHLPTSDALGETARACRALIEEHLGAARHGSPAALRRVEETFDAWASCRAALVRRHLGLVRMVVARTRHEPSQYADLVHEGLFGLVRALERFDPARGTSFSTYAVYWIQTVVWRQLIAMRTAVRVPVHLVQRARKIDRALAEMAPELDETAKLSRIADTSEWSDAQIQAARRASRHRVVDVADVQMFDERPDPESSLSRAKDAERLRQLLPTLDERDRFILSHRFGLDGQPTRSLANLGEELGMSRERVRQLQVAALARLRKSMQTPAMGMSTAEA